MGATLAALSGINNISGPGMLDFESCQSLEKLVVDNEICAMTRRLVQGIVPREDFPSMGIFQELLRDKHLLIAKHTRKYWKKEIAYPGPSIDRTNRSRWLEDGGLTLRQRAAMEVKKHIEAYTPSTLSPEIKQEMIKLMTAEAKKWGMDELPERDA